MRKKRQNIPARRRELSVRSEDACARFNDSRILLETEFVTHGSRNVRARFSKNGSLSKIKGGPKAAFPIIHKTRRYSTLAVKVRAGSDIAECVRQEQGSRSGPCDQRCGQLLRGKPLRFRKGLQSLRAEPD